VQLAGELGDLLRQHGVLLEHASVLLSERLVLNEYLRLVRLVVGDALGLSLAVALEGVVAVLVAVGLARLGQQDQRRSVCRLQ